jgi:DNA-binding protein Fis
MSEPEDVQQLIRLLDPRLANDQTDLYRRALEQFDRVLLKRALEHCEGNLTRAAALLGLSRVTLRSKLRSLGLSPGKQNSSEGQSAGVNAGHSTAHSVVEHPAQSLPHESHPHIPQPPALGRETGQDVTRQDRPSSGFSEPHAADTARREAAGFRNPHG